MHFVHKKAVLGLMLGILSTSLFAQTAARLEALLNEPALNWSAAAAFVLEAADVSGAAGAADAFGVAAERKWLPKKAVPDGAARLDGIALLLMGSFDLKGGMFYRLAKSPHHAYRELVYRGFIRGEADPAMPVSGQQLLLIVSRILSEKEGQI